MLKVLHKKEQEQPVMSKKKWEPFDKLANQIAKFLSTVGMEHEGKSWWWGKNSKCKYISIHIDTRDGHAILIDRTGKQITIDELLYQYKK